MSTGTFGSSEFGPIYPNLAELNRHRASYVILGALLVVLGFIVMIHAFMASVISIFVLGSLIIAGGIVHMVHAFSVKAWSGFMLSLLLSILYIACGVLMVTNPAASAIVLTLAIAGFLIVAGMFRMVSAVALQFPSWGWVVFSGAISFILGLMLWRQWPISGLWVIGTFVGIEMIFSGWTTIMLASTVREAAKKLGVA